MPPAGAPSWIWTRSEGRRGPKGASRSSLLSGWVARWRICLMGEPTHRCGRCLILIPTIHDSGACMLGRKRPLRCWPSFSVSRDHTVRQAVKIQTTVVTSSASTSPHFSHGHLCCTPAGTSLLAYYKCICCTFLQSHIKSSWNVK